MTRAISRPPIHNRDHARGGSDAIVDVVYAPVDSTENALDERDSVHSEHPTDGPETAGYVLTADGAGGSSWAPTGAGGVALDYAEGILSRAAHLVAYWRMGAPSGNIPDESGNVLGAVDQVWTSGTVHGTYDVTGALPAPQDDGAFRFNYNQSATFASSDTEGDRFAAVANRWRFLNRAPYSIGLLYYPRSGWSLPANVAQFAGTIDTDGFSSCGYGIGSIWNRQLRVFRQSDTLDTSFVVATNTWHQIHVTYDGTTLSLYLNGALVTSMTSTVNVAVVGSAPVDRFKLGYGNHGGSGAGTTRNRWDYCILDEVAVYDVALTADEIAQDAINALLATPAASVVTSIAKTGSAEITGDVTLSAGSGIGLTETANDIAIANTGLLSIKKTGSAAITGAATLSEGTNVTLTQSGNDIAIAASGGGGAGAASAARVFNSANQSIPHNTTTVLTFDSERYDTDNYHSTSSNTSRLTAPVAGKYDVKVCVSIAANATGIRDVLINKNGTDTVAQVLLPSAGATFQTIIEVACTIDLAAGDYVEAAIYQNSGVALNSLAAAKYAPEFSIELVVSDTTLALNAQTGTTYTLVLADAGKLVTLSNASAITLTVPTNASVAYAIGTSILLAQLGAGQVTVAGAGGVTVSSRGAALKIAGQYGAATLIKIATDTWLLTGDITT